MELIPYRIMATTTSICGFNTVDEHKILPEKYTTRAEAEKKCKKLNRDGDGWTTYSVVQPLRID